MSTRTIASSLWNDNSFRNTSQFIMSTGVQSWNKTFYLLNKIVNKQRKLSIQSSDLVRFNIKLHNWTVTQTKFRNTFSKKPSSTSTIKYTTADYKIVKSNKNSRFKAQWMFRDNSEPSHDDGGSVEREQTSSKEEIIPHCDICVYSFYFSFISSELRQK